MKLGSLFDGSGGFPLAGVMHGVTPVWASEIEPYPVRVTTARFPGMKHLGDVTKIDGAAIEPVDIITFGSPCQDLSVAGKQAGLHDGERSNLFFEAIRIIKEMRRSTDGIYPRIAVWENVPGAFSSHSGKDFQSVLKAFVGLSGEAVSVPFPQGGKWTAAGCIVGNGFSVAWRTLDAQYNGVPQRRKRIYLIADFGSERAGEILFKQEGVRRDSAESGTAGEGAADNAKRSVGRGGECLTPWDVQSAQIHTDAGAWPALWSEHSGARGYVLRYAEGSVGRGVWPTVAGSLRARGDLSPCVDNGQPFVCQLNGDRGNSYPTTSKIAYCLAANPMSDRGQSVCYAVDRYNQTIADTMQTVRPAVGGDNVGAVCYSIDQQGGKGGANYAENIMPPILSDSHGTPHGVCYAIQTAHPRNADEAQGREPTDKADTINVFDNSENRTPTVVCMGNGQLGGMTGATIANALDCMHDQQAVIVADHKPPRRYIIRRLSPLECARLQGFPDWWEDGVEGSDSARYKMWGNGIALPCAAYIVGCAVKLIEGGL